MGVWEAALRLAHGKDSDAVAAASREPAPSVNGGVRHQGPICWGINAGRANGVVWLAVYIN
jgi:hypothetical protein